MKKYLWILAAAVALVACGNKETPVDPTSEFTVKPTSLSFTESDTAPKFLQVKASGGIRSREAAEAMIAAGATRIGASSSKKIIEG